MDKIISSTTSIVIPGIVVKYAMEISGQYGCAAFSTALSTIGGGSMYRGAGIALVTVAGTQRVMDKALEQLAIMGIRQLHRQGTSKEDILDVIDKLPVSNNLRCVLKANVYENL